MSGPLRGIMGANLPPEAPVFAELRRTLANWDDWPPEDPDGEAVDGSTKAVIDAARAVLEAHDEQLMAYAYAMQPMTEDQINAVKAAFGLTSVADAVGEALKGVIVPVDQTRKDEAGGDRHRDD